MAVVLAGCGAEDTAAPSTRTPEAPASASPAPTQPPAQTPAATPSSLPSPTQQLERPGATPPATRAPGPTPPSLTWRSPNDAEVFRFLFAEEGPGPEAGFYEHYPGGVWSRWDQDLDGDGKAEIVVAATDRWSANWFTILRWEGDHWARALEQAVSSKYYAGIQATFDDVTGDGQPEVVVDTLTYDGGSGIVSVWWTRRLARCAAEECRFIWSDELLEASTSYQPDIGSADLVVRRCEPTLARQDAGAAPQLLETCSGFDVYAFGQGRPPPGTPDSSAVGAAFPLPFQAEKALAPTEERVFVWDGQAYAQTSSREVQPGQVIAREFSGRSQEARALVDEAVRQSLQAVGKPTSGEGFWAAVDASWGLQAEGEQVALAAAGELGPPPGPEVVGVIVGGEPQGCRLAVLTREPPAAYAPAEAVVLPCEPNFARLEALDLDGDKREEILFHTLAVTATQPILYDRLTVFSWAESGLEALFKGWGALPDAVTRGVSAADLDGDGVYEILQVLPAFDLEVRDEVARDGVDWPSLDRTYVVWRWDAEAGAFWSWQTRREPFDRPGTVEILEEAP